jgi:transcriptional regulator with XRE-family HTH domain
LKPRLSKSLYTPEWESLCAILRQLRERKSVTQVDLSERLQQPQSFVSKIESGQRKLDLRQFVLYVRALDADPTKVFRDFVRAFDSASESPRD